MNVVKNRTRFLSVIIFFFSIIILGAISFSGCEVGLGSAVDTQPPSISILKPGVDKVIRNKFLISGTWSDDGTIANIYVILKRTDGKTLDGTNLERQIVASFEADPLVKDSGTWEALVDPLDQEQKIIDGTYQATVVINDKGNHTNSQSTTFTIDNTPPVIVLNRPSTSDKSVASDTYGQTFNLEGQAADTNNVSLIEVEIFSDPECTVLKHTVPLKNVPNSINMDVAKFVKGDEDNDYYKIYGHSDTDAGEQIFYFKLIAYDGSERFPIDGSEQTEADKKGNYADYYYLYKDVASLVLQEYKITDVYSIYNGTYSESSSARAVSTSDVLQILEEKKISKGKFTLNPKNNPTFAIAGRNPLLLDGNDFKNGRNDVSNGGQVVIEVSPGLDSIPLDEDSLRVYAQKCNDLGIVDETEEKIYPTTSMTPSGDAYRFATTILRSEGFEIGNNYIFGVEGYDTSAAKNPVEPSGKAYGIHLASSGNAPKLEVTTPTLAEDVYKSLGQSQVFEGTVSVEAGVPILNVYKGDNSDPIITKIYTEEDGVYQGANIVYSFNETVSDFSTINGKGKVVFRFVATQDGIDSPAVERTVIYDITAPEISITEPVRASKYDDEGNLDLTAKYVNETVVFDAVIKDKGGANLASAKYEVVVDNSVVKTGAIDFDDEAYIEVDTTDPAINGKTFIFRITAQDNAGNITTSDDSKYTYIADQSTDIPILVKHVLSEEEIAEGKKELDFELKSIAAYNSLTKDNKLGTVTKGDYIKFNCYDDDGTVLITIKNKKLSADSDWITDVNRLSTVYNKSRDTKTLITFDDYQFPNTDDECGFYEYAVVLTAGNKTKTIGPFLVNVAKERATIKIQSTPEWAKDGDSFTNTISITPSMGKYYAFKKLGDADYSVTAFKETDELEFTDEISVSELPFDETKVTYKIVDGNNQTSNEVYVTLKKDNDVPERVLISAPAEGKINKSAISDDEYAFRGEVKDNKSGIKYIYYYFGSEASAPDDISKYTREEASNGNYIINKTIDDGAAAVTAGNLYEGKWYLHLKAEDAAGNVSQIVSRQFDVDKAAPVLTETGEDDLGYKNGAFTLNGTITETNGLAATDGLVITDDKDSTYKKVVTPDGENWSQQISGLSEGKHTLTITATDKVQKTTVLKRIVTMDCVKPVVADTMTLPNGYSFAASSISLSGTATDAAPSSGLSKVEYYFTDGLTSSAKKSNVFTAEGAAYWSASIPVSVLTASEMNDVFTEQGTKYITVTAYDNAGNASEPVIKSFVYDIANPEISNVQIKYTDSESSTALGTETVYTNINGYTISGSFNDTGSNVTIGVTSNGNNVDITQTSNAISGNWSFTTSALEDMSYSYIITATDASGRTATVKAYIVVDKTNPVVVISESEDIYKNSGAHTFNGTITEANLDIVRAYLYKNNGTTLVKQEQIYPVNNAWTWTVVGLEKAEYTIKVEATDKAGNHGNKTSAKLLVIDTAKPEISIKADKVLYNMSGATVAAQTALTASGIYYANEGFTLSGTITEDHIETVSLKNGETPLQFTSGGTSAGNWSYTQTKTDGEYEYDISVSDKAGNSNSVKVTVKIDTTAPDINTIIAPVEGKTGVSAITDSTYIFKGSAADKAGGTGVTKIWYAFTDSSEAPGTTANPVAGYTALNVNDGEEWSIVKTVESGSSAQNAGNLYEGKWYLHIKAQDKAGNISETAETRQFDLDKSDPTLTASVTTGTSCKKSGDTYYFNNQNLTGSVAASDSAGTVSLKYKVGNGTEVDLPVTTGSWTIGADKFAENAVTVLTIKALDLVGKTKTVEFKITKDLQGPSVNPESPGTVFGAPVIRGSVDDSNGSGFTSLWLSTTQNGTYTQAGTYSAGTDQWSYTLTDEDLGTAEGSRTYWFKAKDLLGNEGIPASVSFNYDKNLPEITITGVYATETGTPYVKQSYTLQGTAWDTNSLDTIIISQNGTQVSDVTLTGAATAKSQETAATWTKTFTPAANVEATYKYVIKAKDISGRESEEIIRTIAVDTKNPVITIDESETDYYTSSTAYTFAGTIEEGNLSTLYVNLIKNGDEDNPVETKRIYPVNNEWNWTATGLTDAEYTIKVQATDKAGNSSEKQSSKKIIVDTVKPVINTKANVELFNMNGTAVSTQTALTSSGTYFTKTGFTLNGTLNETNLKTATIKIGNSNPTNLTVNNGSWTYTQTGTYGTYSYTITAIDKANNSDSLSFTITIDNEPPAQPSITAPVLNKTGKNSLSDNTYIFKGNTSDNEGGTGVAKLLYVFIDATEEGADVAPAAGYTSIDASDGSWTITKTIDNGPAAQTTENLHEGKYYLYVKAQDKAGNTSTAKGIRFDIDKKDPEISLTSVVNDIYSSTSLDNNSKGSFTLSGNVSDTYGVASVTISDGTTSYTPSVSNGIYTITLNYGSGNSAVSNYLADEVYTFTIKVTDCVGKETSITKKITIDTNPPELSNIRVNGEESNAEKWYNTTDMKLSGSASDNAGVSEVVYKTSTNGTTWSTTEEPFIGTASWKGTISEVASNTTRIKIIARDNAGNEASAIVGPWKIDVNPPSLTSVKEGNETLSEATAYYSNGQNNITLTIIAADGANESGVDRVYVLPYAKLSAGTVIDANKAVKQSDGSYKITIQKTALTKSGTVYARIYDVAGNYTDENLFAITLDSTKPVLQSYALTQVAGQNSSAAYKKDATTYYVNPDNKTFTLTGIATDNLAIGSVNLTMKVGSTVKYNQSVTDGEWSFSGINMSGWGGDGTTVTATITVTDKALNTQDTTKSVVSEFSIIFDKTKPTSDHQIDAKGKDLVFRISDGDNDDISSDAEADNYAAHYNLIWNSATVGGTEYTNIDSKSGGKYSAGTFGNSTTVKVRGVFEDSASGIKRIYYRVFDRSDDNSSSYILNGTTERYNLTDTELNSLIDEVLSKNLYFEPDGTTEYKRVFYNVNKAAYDAASDDEKAALTLGGTPLEKKDSNNVLQPVVDKGYYKYWKIIPTTYTFTIPSIKEGSNYLVLVAEDNAGNKFIDTVTVKFDHDGNPQTADINAAFSNFSMNLDTTAPTIESTHNDIIYSNGTDECNISVTVEDPVVAGIANSSSGVKSVVFSRDGTAETVKATANGNTYTADIKKLLPSNGTVLIYATVTDNAYTSLKKGIATVAVDTTPPTVTIKSPVAESNVNKTITLKFTAADSGNGSGVSNAAAPELYYSTKATAPGFDTTEDTGDFTENATTGWKKLTATPTYNDGEWSLAINTTQFNNTGTDKSVFFTVSANDNVGNTGYAAAHKLVINQDGDRPVIKMNQVKQDGSGYLTTKTVFGSVSDDDGAINKLWVWSTKLNSGNPPTSAPALTDNGKGPTGWISFGAADSKSTLENNNWQIDSSEADGSTTWFWAVADADNTIFWTKNSSSLNQPYITYSDENKQPNTTGITFKYDTESPEINSVELLRLATNVYKTGNTRYAASEIAEYVSENNNLEWSSANNIVFGKDYALMYVKVEVTEKTAMNSTTPIALDYITLANTDISVGDPVNNKYTYYLGPFDLSTKTTENKTLTFTAKDDAGKTGSKEKAIVVDNAANITISNVSPAVDEIASGKFTYRGQVNDAESSVTRVEYFIPTYSENTALATATTAAEKKTLLDSKSFTHITTATSIQWSIDFNNFNADVLGYTTNGTEVEVDENFEDYDIGDNVYRVPVWFKVTDSVGNIGYVTDNEITYDPNEDRPKVYITDPEISTTPVEKGGRIKISGNAQDNEGIAAVYLQFNVNNTGWTNSTAGGAVKIPGTDANPIYGFLANNTKNWNYTYSVTGIDNDKVVQVRAIAADSDTGLLSSWSDTLRIKVNNTIPFVDGDMYLRQYNGNTVTVEQIYYPGIYIKGDWKLEGKISTEKSDYLKSMSITLGDKTATWTTTTTKDEQNNETSTHTGVLIDSDNIGVSVSLANANNEKSLAFSIPVSGSSAWTAEIQTYDKADHYNTEAPSINIDNTAPSFADYTDKPNNKIVLYQDSYGAGGIQLGSEHFIQNSNGAQFTLAGKIVEEQSGFDKAVFYFKRTGSDGVARVYNPMEVHGTDNQNNRTNIASSKANAVAGTGGTIYINSDKLPVRPLTVTRSTTESAQNNEIMTNMNIRAGGLVYIGGLYRLITEVNRTTGTIKFEPEAAATNTDAEFVYGLVVDHNGERDNGNGGVDFDDGDGLLESYSGSTTANFRWEATFNSANIPDGPIDIYVITFDKAGNIGYGYLTTKASNNAPRITKVMFGTDLNGNGVYDYDTDEFSTFYAFEDESTGTVNTKKGNANWTLDTSTKLNSGKYWTAKNGIAVIPEFVGGAGPFYYVFDKGVVTGEGKELKDFVKTTPSTFTYSSTPANNPVLLASGSNAKIKTGGASGTNATWTYGTSTSGANTGGSLTLDNNALDTTTGEYSKSGETETNPAVVYTFTFWDSTEESTPGTDTGSTILNAYVRQDLTDDVVPNSVIKPFEWNGTGYSKTVSTVTNGGNPSVTAATLETLTNTDNLGSVVTGTGTTTVTTTTITPNNNLYGASKANGHIELENDLTDAVKAVTVNSTALGDDPKVSGKITFHGTSYDNTRLSSIWFKFTDFTANNGRTEGDTGKTGTTGYTQAAYYDVNTAAWLLAPATMTDNNWEFTVTDTYFNQTGHKVDWYLSIDTSKISGTAGIDKTLTVITLDSAGKVSSTTASAQSNDDAVYNKPTYKMDVVPYITGVYRNSTFNTNRARSGATPLLRGEETNIIVGFNLDKPTNTTLAINLNTKADGTGTTYNMTSPAVVTAGSKLSFTMPTTAKDGYLTVTVNGIKTLNNLNDDSKVYNKENTENVSSTDYWTDTRLVRVWQNNTGDYFKDSTLPIYPSMSMGTGGTLYASFSNYSASAVYYATVGASGTRTQVFYGYDPPEETDICVSGEGTVNVIYNANYHGGTDASWAADSDSCGGLYMYDKNAASVWVGRDTRKILRFELFYHNRMLQQFKNMRVKRADSSNTGIVHVAYYDRTTNSIHYSEVASNYSYTTYTSRQVQNNQYVYVDTSDNEISWVSLDGGTDTDDDKYHNGSSNKRYNDQISSVSLTDARFEDTKRCSGTGESVGLALTKTNQYPVVVYYDATNSVLKLARATSKTPKGDVSKWSVQEVLGSSDINYKTMVDYIACDIDSSGYLHIVFQNSKGQLCYIKSTNTSADGATKYTFGSSVVVADSATNIDLTLKGTVPYVSYLTKINSFDGMNIAFWDSTLDPNCDGTAEGAWETMTAALNYKVSNVKSCIEAHPTPASADWEAAVGFTPGDLYRVAYYVGNGSGH